MADRPLRADVVGGGPGGLFAALLLKKDDSRRRIRVWERNRFDDTYGFGVVFSDATLDDVGDADPALLRSIEERFHHWDDIRIDYRGELLESTGHGFAGLGRRELLMLLQQRCHEEGVEVRFETEAPQEALLSGGADLLIGADGVSSTVRRRWEKAFQPSVDIRPNRFVWMGTTRPFPAFTFRFREDPHGLWRVHAYQYAAYGNGSPGRSTFIVEATEDTWRSAGMDQASERETADFLSGLFADMLGDHRLVSNKSVWRQFPTVRNARWWLGPAEAADARSTSVVLLGDAAHTAHFSVGSGTRLAMMDAISLARSLARCRGGQRAEIGAALAAYEAERRPPVESLQRAAQASLQWFEDTERYMQLEPVQFAFALLTRSLRISHENLRERDPAFVDQVDRWVADKAETQAGVSIRENERSIGVTPGSSGRTAPPPLFTPFRLRELVLPNRVGVSAMCQYSARDGTPDDWHLVNLGSRAVGGAGLLMAEMTAVSREGRISPGCAGIYRPAHVDGWRRLVDFVHKHSAARIGIQLGHAGRKGSTMLDWEGSNEPLPGGGWPVVSASPIPFFEHSPVPAELDQAGMDQMTREYERATGMALEAGFDLVELHMAHGYLLASFLSPLTNQRTDRFGGSLEGRLRFPLRILRTVRGVWPDEKPVSVRLSAVDWWPGGTTPSDAVAIARALKDAGCDIVDVSAGQTVPQQQPVYGRQFQTPFSDRIRHEAGIATMAVGNISSFEDVNGIIAAGRADLCLLARAHLWDPYWTRHAAHALGYPLPWPAQYSTLNEYTPRFGGAAAFGPETTE